MELPTRLNESRVQNALPNKPMRSWKGFAFAFISISILVSINVTIIFREGWILPAFPHLYLYTALQKYHGNVPMGNFSNHIDNVRFSPLYPVSILFGHLGKPTPSWLRLTGVVLLVLIFIVSYFVFPRLPSSIDRLVVALTVTTTPVVLFVTRYLEDFGLHILVLLLSVALLLHSRMGRITSRALPLYLLPALDFLSAHMVTNFLIAMMSFAGLYLYSLFLRIKEAGVVSVIKSEVPRLLLAVSALMIVDKMRLYGGGISFLKYYQSETVAFDAVKYGAQPASWLCHLLAYPGVLCLSAAGLFLCLIALLNISRRFRISHVWMYLLWILIPLVVLTPITKKSTYYVWTLAPAVSLLAASAILKLSPIWKKLWIVACLVFAALHLSYYVSPFEHFANLPVFQGNYLINNQDVVKSTVQKDMEVATEIIKLAEKCGPVENKNLVVMHPPSIIPINIYFAMLYLDQRPIYTFLKNIDLEKNMTFVVVEIIENKEQSIERWQMWRFVLGDYYDTLQKTHTIVYESPTHRVYCPKESSGALLD